VDRTILLVELLPNWLSTMDGGNVPIGGIEVNLLKLEGKGRKLGIPFLKVEVTVKRPRSEIVYIFLIVRIRGLNWPAFFHVRTTNHILASAASF